MSLQQLQNKSNSLNCQSVELFAPPPFKMPHQTTRPAQGKEYGFGKVLFEPKLKSEAKLGDNSVSNFVSAREFEEEKL